MEVDLGVTLQSAHILGLQSQATGLCTTELPAITIIHQIRQAVTDDKSKNAPHDLAVVLSVITSTLSRIAGNMYHLNHNKSLCQALFPHRPQTQQ